jgi:hypothetical protein
MWPLTVGPYNDDPGSFGPPWARGNWGPSKNIDSEEMRQRLRDLRDSVGDRVEDVLTSEEFEHLKASLSKLADAFGAQRCEDDGDRGPDDHPAPARERVEHVGILDRGRAQGDSLGVCRRRSPAHGLAQDLARAGFGQAPAHYVDLSRRGHRPMSLAHERDQRTIPPKRRRVGDDPSAES